MIVDITNELLTLIKNDLSGVATVSAPNPKEVPTFPHVTFRELNTVDREDTIDTSGVKHNDLDFEVEIFTDGDTQQSDAKSIRNAIDLVLSQKGLRRNFSDNIPNFLDERLYRYVMRYSCTVDHAKKVYRR